MARKRKLDQYVTPMVDRHGKERFRFRRNGYSKYLPAPTDKRYREAYAEAMRVSSGALPLAPRHKPGSVSDLLTRYYGSLVFKRGGDGWRTTRRQVLEAFRAEFGDDRVADFRTSHIDTILARKADKLDGAGGTAAAQRLREQLLSLFKFAVKQEWIDGNPVEKAERVDHKTIGFLEWGEEQIAAFRAHWPLGTKPRLAMELILWTGARRGDARLLPPPKDGRIAGKAGKTGKAFSFPVAPVLQRAIEAMPAVGINTLLVTEYGKPFTAAGFGNWFGEKARKAGLYGYTAHGLRKSLTRRAADVGVHQQGLKALGQWEGDREVAIYAGGANRARLYDNALAAVIAWEQESNID